MLGETLALTAAATWSFSVILFKQSEELPPQGLNLFKNLFSLTLLLLTMWVFGIEVVWGRPNEDWIRLIVSGVLGLTIGDTLFFMALKRLGPGLLAVMDCLYAPFVVVLSMFLLGEQISLSFVLGGVFIIGGVLLAVSGGLSVVSGLGWGFAIAAMAIFVMALGVVVVKPALETSHLVEVTTVRLIAGICGQFVWMALFPSQRNALTALKPNPAWKTLIPAAFLGSYVAMLLWLGGFKWADASVAAVLNQMATIFTIGLAWLMLGESLTKRGLLGAAMAFIGVVVVLV